MPYVIKAITDLSQVDITPLLTESQAQGFRFVAKLVKAHQSGSNRFALAGECLLGIVDASAQLVAIGGLNQDPYTQQPRCGRLRHFYVLAAYRQQGLGARLLAALTEAARLDFDTLVLRTPDTTAAARFYEHHGFLAVTHEHHSHGKTLVG